MREELAELCHKQWSGWIKYMFGKSLKKMDGTILIPEWAVKRWRRQAYTPYKRLSTEEKESDLKEAGRFIKLIEGKQAKRIEELEAVIKNACDLINNEGEVNKWKILNMLNQTPKGK